MRRDADPGNDYVRALEVGGYVAHPWAPGTIWRVLDWHTEINEHNVGYGLEPVRTYGETFVKCEFAFGERPERDVEGEIVKFGPQQNHANLSELMDPNPMLVIAYESRR